MVDGRDLRMEPLADRRKRLEDLMQGHPESRIHFSAGLIGNGPAMFRAADVMGLEGIVSKRPESRYISGRTKFWLKIKTFTESVYNVVVGVEESREGATMALLATPRDGAQARWLLRDGGRQGARDLLEQGQEA